MTNYATQSGATDVPEFLSDLDAAGAPPTVGQ